MSKSVLTRWVSTTASQPWQENTLPSRPGAEANLWPSGLRDQAWEGFGGCFNELGWQALSGLDERARTEILDELFDPAKGCRFNLCRLPIGANDYSLEWYSLNETDGDLGMQQFSIERDRQRLIPYIKLALARRGDMKLFASPWSPPTWMKHPRAYNHGTLIWTKEILQAYALYFLKFVQAYRAEGVRIDQVHVQNEPNSDQKFPSCLWTGPKMCEFIRDYLGPLFRQQNCPCEIWAGTIEREDYDLWANLILSDLRARAFVSGVGYQWAGKGAVRRTHESWPDVRILQTENECGDGHNTWEYARYVFSLLHHYIGSGVNGYTYWNMILAPNGKSTWGWWQNSMITIDPQTRCVTRNPEFYVMKHFSHFIEPGAVRLGLAGPWTGNAIAFANPDGQTVVVINNPFRETRTLNFGGQAVELPGQSYNTLVFAGGRQ